MTQTKGMRVLVAEDDPISRRILETRLKKWSYEVVPACDGTEAAQVLESEGAPRLVVMDWMMPGKDGVQLCRELRARDDAPYTYVIMLTARGERDDILEGLDAGADDYICKPFDAQELKVRLRAGSRIVELQDELIKARERLREQATRDPLTGIMNRGAILDVLNGEIARANREHTQFSIVLVDLDHFKAINDRHGHPAGDEVLRTVAEAMRSSTRPYDGIGRFGGEEFLLVLPGAPGHGALQQAERMRLKVASSVVETSSGPLSVTASVGVCGWMPGRNLSQADLLHAADVALYRAKHNGRDRAELARPDDLPGTRLAFQDVDERGATARSESRSVAAGAR